MRAALAFFATTALLLVARPEQSLACSSNTIKIRTSSSLQSSIHVDSLIQESLDDISAKIKEFQKDARRYERPFVTLAYAQSIDGKIALVREDKVVQQQRSTSSSTTKTKTTTTSSNFAISGPESLRLTHALRSIHDAILVGGKTLSVDNPRLTNRMWSVPIHKEPCVPVILDTHLNHIRLLGNTMRAQNPIVCCSAEAYEQALRDGYSGPNHSNEDVQTVVANKGSDTGSIPPSVTLLPCKTKVVKTNENDEEKQLLDLHHVLSSLYHEHGINSLMVEGGASVLSLFAGDAREQGNDDGGEENNNKYLFDCLCVTISPKLLGSNGLDSLPFLGANTGDSKGGVILGPLKCISLGEDCVLFADRQT